jgi:hypothetical protein
MRFVKSWWLVVVVLVLAPHAALALAGFWWLARHGLLLHWLAAGSVLTAAGWAVSQRLRRKRLPLGGPEVQPSLAWPPSGHAAWDDVEAVAERVQAEPFPFDRPEALRDLLIEVLETVARHYRPNARQAALEVPVPYALRVVELVTQDLRQAFSEYLPWSHILTLGDFMRLKRWTAWLQELYLLYRVARVGFNPMAAVLGELRGLATGRLQDVSAEAVKQWAIGYAVRRAGYYAIQLYGGYLVLDDADLGTYQTRRSRGDARRAGESAALAGEPLRILVVGQVKAGKSSLINALFGRMRAAVDVLPTTRGVDPYLLERDGLDRAIVLDTAGYESVDQVKAPLEAIRDQAADCDLLLLVCSAQSASRDADRRMLDGLRAFFAERPDRVMPATVVVLTHVDLLRPIRAWNPPYDLANPNDEKARQIVDAVRAVEHDLALTAEQPVVPVCLHPDRIDNVDEGLVPVILQQVPQAERVKYLRCLKSHHEEEYWQRLWRQAVNSGRVLLKAGRDWMRP